MTLLKHGVAAAITIAGALAFSGVAIASSADFIDNGHYTTDTNNGLDWLDVTISVNQSYNYVSSQFGSGGEYEGWRYATGTEFNRMVSSWTGSVIADTDYGLVVHQEGDIDQLHFLLGSTLDSRSVPVYGDTADALNNASEGDFYDYTKGIISDRQGMFVLAALIRDADQHPTSKDTTKAHTSIFVLTQHNDHTGSFLVRDTHTPVPVPAAVWLMGSSLLGLLGYSRQRKPTIAA